MFEYLPGNTRGCSPTVEACGEEDIWPQGLEVQRPSIQCKRKWKTVICVRVRVCVRVCVSQTVIWALSAGSQFAIISTLCTKPINLRHMDSSSYTHTHTNTHQHTKATHGCTWQTWVPHLLWKTTTSIADYLFMFTITRNKDFFNGFGLLQIINSVANNMLIFTRFWIKIIMQITIFEG